MNATFLHQQYGEQSWGLSAGGYASAVLTGAGRQLNNRHWISDVLAGAAIGIASAELGHYLAGKLFTNKPSSDLSHYNTFNEDINGYLGIRMDYRIALNTRNENIFVGPGSGIGMDAGWLVNKHLGIGVEAGLFAHPMYVDLPHQNGKVTLMGRYLRTGPIFKQHIGSDWTLNSRLMFGVSPIYSTSGGRTAVAISKDIPNTFNLEAGFDLQKKINQHLGLKTFFYYDSPKKIKITPAFENFKMDNNVYPPRFHTISFGAGIYALF